MNRTRLAAALNELAAALLDDTTGAAGATPPAPAAAFAAAKPPTQSDPGLCPVHETPWKTTKGDGSPAKRAYCSQKDADGEYCSERGPWLTSR